MIWQLVIRLAGTAAVILAYRYLLRLGTPRRDWWQLEEWALRLGGWLTRRTAAMRLWLYTMLGLTDAAWRELRARYQSGKFGEAGT